VRGAVGREDAATTGDRRAAAPALARTALLTRNPDLAGRLALSATGGDVPRPGPGPDGPTPTSPARQRRRPHRPAAHPVRGHGHGAAPRASNSSNTPATTG
jgi:hypothetical protein